MQNMPVLSEKIESRNFLMPKSRKCVTMVMFREKSALRQNALNGYSPRRAHYNVWKRDMKYGRFKKDDFGGAS